MNSSLDIAIAEAEAVLKALIANPTASHAEESVTSTFRWYRDLCEQRDIERLRAKLISVE